MKIVVSLVAVYLASCAVMPAMIARRRGLAASEQAIVAAFGALTGWTGFGAIAAWIYALAAESKSVTIHG